VSKKRIFWMTVSAAK